MMRAKENVFLGISVLLSWGFGFFIHTVLTGNGSVSALIGLVFGALLLWLAPFALLVLFSDNVWVLLAAFILGSLGFLVAAFNWYMGIGLLLLLAGFAYWAFSVRYARDLALSFSTGQIMQGIGFFFTMLAIFGSFLYFYSPFSSRETVAPIIPEQLFDVIYHPISQILFAELPAMPGSEAIDPEIVKPQIYRVVNEALGETAKKYQEYIPLAFAAAVFFALRAIFYPLKYALFGLVFLLVKVFLYMGWLHGEIIEVKKEIIKF